MRDGVMGVLEYKPNDDFRSILDVYYSKFDQNETMRGIMWSNDPWTGNGVTLSNPTDEHAAASIVTGGTLNNLEPIVRNDCNTRTDDMFAAAGRTNWDFNDNWSVIADLATRAPARAEHYGNLCRRRVIAWRGDPDPA